MITEDYVSFEIAKLLKEKGFNEECNKSYSINGTLYSNFPKDCILAPTLQMAMKWLREKYSLHCDSSYDYVLGWFCQITSLKETTFYDCEELKQYHPTPDNNFCSYEEACETAIKYCLENLI